MNFKRVLILAPHTDDAELGCGGTMARFLSEGVHVHVAAFSTAEGSVPPGAPPTTLRDEFVESMGVFGISPNDFSVFNYPVRKLTYHRQEVLEELIRIRGRINPDIVFVPSGSDLHQDHQVLYAEGLRAFKDISVWGYELPWNHIKFSANAFVTFNQDQLDLKWKALETYRSQIYLERSYFTRPFVESLARVRGVQVRANFAEAFEVMRIRI